MHSIIFLNFFIIQTKKFSEKNRKEKSCLQCFIWNRSVAKVNLPSSQYPYLCSAGSQLQQDLSTYKSPDAFFVLTQSDTSIPSSICIDSIRKFFYFPTENK